MTRRMAPASPRATGYPRLRQAWRVLLSAAPLALGAGVARADVSPPTTEVRAGKDAACDGHTCPRPQGGPPAPNPPPIPGGLRAPAPPPPQPTPTPTPPAPKKKLKKNPDDDAFILGRWGRRLPSPAAPRLTALDVPSRRRG